MYGGSFTSDRAVNIHILNANVMESHRTPEDPANFAYDSPGLRRIGLLWSAGVESCYAIVGKHANRILFIYTIDTIRCD